MENQNWFNEQYLPSRSIGDVSAIFDSWLARATVAQNLPHRTDLHYGAHTREVLDFFPAQNSRGCVVYIHGGYWMGFSKFETSWVAQGFLEQGYSVALINYPLCPEVTIADIQRSCSMAMHFLLAHVLSGVESNNVVVTGHSAGGYLAASLLTQELPLKGVVSLSGVFDVAPLMQTSLQENLRLDATQAAALNLMTQKPQTPPRPCVLAVGSLESSEFKRQSAELTASWGAKYVEIGGANHFTIVDDLAQSAGSLNQLALGILQS